MPCSSQRSGLHFGVCASLPLERRIVWVFDTDGKCSVWPSSISLISLTPVYVGNVKKSAYWYRSVPSKTIPSCPDVFRPVCNDFVVIYLVFINRRARLKVTMRIETVPVRTCSSALLVFFITAPLLQLAGDVEKNPGPLSPMDNKNHNSTDNGDRGQCCRHSKIIASIQQLAASQETMRSSLEQKAGTVKERLNKMESKLDSRLQQMKKKSKLYMVISTCSVVNLTP